MRGGGSKAVRNFSENSSVLEGVGVPYLVKEKSQIPSKNTIFAESGRY